MQANNKHRNNELARIHVLKKDDCYRDMLFSVAQVRSSAKLDQFARSRVIGHMMSLKRQSGISNKKKKDYPGRPHNCDDNPQLKKIEALLTVNKLPWSYADNIAKQMYQKDKLAFCKPAELTGVITALRKAFGDDYDR